MAVPQIGSISMACTNISPSPTTTMAGGGDRLSTLGDDLLRRILHFVPTKEAASTSVLSRRWRSLWRSSGAVNLAVRVHEDERDHSERTFFSRRDAFVHAAKAALAAADARVTRLTFRVAADDNNVIYRFLHGSRDWRTEHDVVGDVLSHPAARSVEELRVAAGSNLSGFFPDSEDYVVDSHSHRDIGIYDLASLPSSERLRVLDLTGCRSLAPAAATAAFPRLATLRLRLCCVQSGDLQALVDAAPGLATVQLESVLFKRPTRRAGTAADDAPGAVRLRFPAATALALELCGMEGEQRWSGDNGAIEIDAPRLRSFTYKGSLRQFRLRSPAPDIASVDVHFVRGVYERHHGSSHSTRVLFWQFVHNFADARALRLKVNYLKDIAAVGKPNRKELLFVFPNAMRLELEGVHDPSSKTAAVAVANLLRCCPVLCDLKLKLSTVPSDSDKDSNYGRAILEQKDRLDYNRSVDRFMRRTRLNPMISLDDGNDDYHKVSDIPGLSGHCFACLQSSLTRVGLQFRLDSNSNCFGVRLVKFFAHHGKVLKEMCVDSGNRKLCEHMNLDVERWVAPNAIKACLKRKNPTECLWEFSKVPKKSHDSATNSRRRTEGFTVLPLQR